MFSRKWIAREILAFLVVLTVVSLISGLKPTYESISYKEFLKLLNQKDVTYVGYNEPGKTAIVFKKSEDKYYEVGIVSSEKFEEDIYNYSVSMADFTYANYVPKQGLGLGATILLAISINILFRYCWNKVDNKLSNRGKKDKDNNYFNKLGIIGEFQPRKAENIEVRFKDVIGLEKQIDEVQDIVRFLKEPEKYEAIGAKLPKGILLYGKPGVGKTYIASAIAGEAGVPFYEISASELQARYLGDSEERIRILFKEAEQNAPAIIYIDEIDSIATQRYSDNSNKYAASILNQLLACMDGFTKDSRVIVIAATNYIETLDRALLRSGRFDRKIYIQEPNKESRRKLFEYYSADKVLSDRIDIEKLVDITSGFTGADIKTILNEAALLAVRYGEKAISENTIMESFRKMIIGSKSSSISPTKEQLEKTAVHESGHAVISRHFGFDVSEISIIARGNAAGYNLGADADDYNYNYNQMKHKVMSLLAGRAAEELIYSEPSAGASDDLKRASALIESMVLKFSMHDSKGVSIVLTDDRQLDSFKAEKAYEEMNELMRKLYSEVTEILSSKKELLIQLKNSLMQKETLSKEEILAILG